MFTGSGADALQRVEQDLIATRAGKAGLWAATQNLAKELAPHQILVNAITPGATITKERRCIQRRWRTGQ